MENEAKIYDGAKIIGDVKLGKNVSVWYNAVIRADHEPVCIDDNSNVQDNCVVHVTKGYPVNIGKNVSIGHGAIIHGCSIDDNCLIGMGAIILNGAKINKNCLVGAGALITENKEFPEGSLIIGSPAKAVKKLTPEQLEGIKDNADEYLKLAFNK